jgi:hypothetical protein
VTTSLLQLARSDHQIGPSEDHHQPVETTPLVRVRAGLEVFLQYALRFADRLKGQPLISHCFLPIQKIAGG